MQAFSAASIRTNFPFKSIFFVLYESFERDVEVSITAVIPYSAFGIVSGIFKSP
uniref:Uncharacterized protein n=1 Tax=Thorea hispida TaxID=202687 RepID=A0A1Z1XAN3_9FLOR|nr:hypothetical protein [Thorea hispida]